MGVSKEQLAKIIAGRSRELCSVEGDRLIDEAKNRRSSDYYDPDPSSYNDAEYFDSLYTDSNDEAYSSSKMPQAIKESMIKNPIDTSALSNTSVLDTLNVPRQKRQQRRVNEEVSHQSQSPSVDYSIIKAIVNECLNEYFSKSQQLNEGTLKTIGLKSGKITLVDNKGNTYVANLQKIER